MIVDKGTHLECKRPRVLDTAQRLRETAAALSAEARAAGVLNKGEIDQCAQRLGADSLDLNEARKISNRLVRHCRAMGVA